MEMVESLVRSNTERNLVSKNTGFKLRSKLVKDSEKNLPDVSFSPLSRHKLTLVISSQEKVTLLAALFINQGTRSRLRGETIVVTCKYYDPAERCKVRRWCPSSSEVVRCHKCLWASKRLLRGCCRSTDTTHLFTVPALHTINGQPYWKILTTSHLKIKRDKKTQKTAKRYLFFSVTRTILAILNFQEMPRFHHEHRLLDKI